MTEAIEDRRSVDDEVRHGVPIIYGADGYELLSSLNDQNNRPQTPKN